MYPGQLFVLMVGQAFTCRACVNGGGLLLYILVYNS